MVVRGSPRRKRDTLNAAGNEAVGREGEGGKPGVVDGDGLALVAEATVSARKKRKPVERDVVSRVIKADTRERDC